jgi:alpha-L-fucosidase 2
MQWKEGKITKVDILSKAGQSCRINPGVNVVVKSKGKNIEFKKHDDGSIEFSTAKGTHFSLRSLTELGD